jgi:hypothetical protein
MFRFFMISVWAAGAYFLATSYVRGLAQLSGMQASATKAMADTALGGPFEGFKNMGDMGVWFHIAAIISIALYALFSKQIWKEFGPNAKN